MIQDLKNLQRSINRRFKICKSIVYIINTHRFLYLFENAEENSQIHILKLIKEENINAIKSWIKQENGLNNTDLRMLGRKYGIKNYGRLSIRELIYEIKKYQPIC